MSDCELIETLLILLGLIEMCERETLIPVGFHVNLILNRLRNAQALRELHPDENKDVDSDGDGEPTKAPKQSPEDERQYIEHRLREIASWERKINGGAK